MSSFFLKNLNENFSLKLFILFVVFVFIVFFSFTAVLIHFGRNSLNDSLISDSELLANILAHSTRLGVYSENESLLKDPVDAIFKKEDILDISIYTKDGVLIKNKKRKGVKFTEDAVEEKDKTTNIFKQISETGATIYHEDHSVLKFWTPVFSSYEDPLNGTVFSQESRIQEKDPLIGYVQVTVGKDKLNKQLNNLLIRSILIAVLFFVAGSILIYSFLRRITKPLERLIDAANKLSAGEIVEKVNVETNDEIGKLANAFNNMAESIKWREQALRESEIKYRSLFEESRDVIFIINTEDRFEDANQAALDLFGYSKNEILEIGLNELFILPDELISIKSQISNDNYVIDREISLKKKNGIPLECLLTLSLRRNGRNIQGYQGIIRDVTHQKALETQLQQAKKMESIGTLAGGIAHDFNNILSPIMLHSEMVMEDLAPDDPSLLSIKEIHVAASRARDLVKQILTFARKRSEEKIVLRASLIIKEATKLLRSTIPTTIDIKYYNKAEQDTVLADPTQINQIIMNLCTNAAFAMREKGGLLEVTLQNEDISAEKANKSFDLTTGRYLILSVKDNGTGIAPNLIERIFEPYFTTKKFGEGTGFGLATIHGIVKSIGGYITVDSTEGKGTTFYVYLPTIDAEDSDADEKEIVIPKGTERILFVDDEKPAVDSMLTMLERLGYKVTARTSSIEALEAFRNAPEAFDLVITDMTMPNMTGKELTMELKKIRPDIPIILCTGFSDQIDERKAKKIGIDAFIMKPIIRSKIANSIREILEKNN